jgi:rhamnosyltransferase
LYTIEGFEGDRGIDTVKTSVIIPTKNAGEQLAELLESLQSQTISGQIIIIDSSSSDSTQKIAESHGIRTIVTQRNAFDHGGTRTRAAQEADGDILIFMTQDALPADEYAIEKLIQPFDDEHVAATFGRQLPKQDASLFSAHNRRFNYPEKSSRKTLKDKKHYGIKTPFLSNSFAAYRKQALEGVGWFKQNLISTEDMYAGAKLLLAGYALAYVSDALVYHSHDYSLSEEFKRYFDIGVFHKSEAWIQREFGTAQGEGIKYIRSEFASIIKERKFRLVPEFFMRNTLKYAGYLLGKHNEKIPERMRRKMSRNAVWWDKKKK